jgi:hypothetical protein
MAKGIAHRDWSISRDDYRDEDGRTDDASFRAAVQNELALAEHIGERLGVAIVAAPIRTRLAGGSHFTVGWAFKTATVPSTREQTPEPFDDTLDDPSEYALDEGAEPLVVE